MRHRHLSPILIKVMQVASDKAAGLNQVVVIAMDTYGHTHLYPAEVKLTIRQEKQADYLEALNYINPGG